MGTNVNKKAELLKKLSLVDSTRQILISCLGALVSRADDLFPLLSSDSGEAKDILCSWIDHSEVILDKLSKAGDSIEFLDIFSL